MKLIKVLPIATMLLLLLAAGCKKDDDAGVRPTVTSTDPINAGTGAGVDNPISATFSTAMDASTITDLKFKITKDNASVPGVVTYTGKTATFTPVGNLSPKTVYTATISTGVKDVAGRTLSRDFVWTFTTGNLPDTTPPTVTMTSPLNNATSVAVNASLVTTFSEPMDPTSLTTATILLKQGALNIGGAIAYTGGTTVTFTPTVNLEPASPYTLTITTGAQDVAGNGVAIATIFAFTTAAAPDTALPMVNASDPLNNATGVPRNKDIAITFSEDMDPLTITSSTFTLTRGTTPVNGIVTYSGTTAKFTPSAPLAAATTYTASITNGVKDIAGNALAATMVWTFTTGGAASTLAVVNLGDAGNYVILAKTAINNSSTTAITGDLGLSPAAESYITGLALTDATGYATSAQVTGKVYAADMASPTPINLTTAVNNMITAYNDAAGRPSPDFSELGTGNIGGKTLTPGLYKWTSTVTIPTDVVISGGANDVWIFQIAGNLTMSSAVNMTLSNGAQAKNIFWQVAGQATLGTTSHVEGIILSMTGITFQTGGSMNGRALAQTAVILDSNAITKP